MMDDQQQQWLMLMHRELLPPIEAIATTSRALLDAASDPDLEVEAQTRNDLRDLCDAAEDLYDYARSSVDQVVEVFCKNGQPSTAAADPLKDIRHGIRNRLNHVLGPCQFLLMEQFNPQSAEQDRFFGSFTDDLKAVVDYAELSLQKLGTLTSRRVQEDTASRISTEIPEFTVGPAERVDQATILVADDDPLNRGIIKRYLERRGHRLLEAPNGRLALELIERVDLDLVLLDILMPELNGLQVLQRLAEDGRLSHLPVVVISGLDSTREIAWCLEAGAEDFLSRPINLTLLKARVNGCLERQRLQEREYAQFFPRALARQLVRRPEALDEGRECEVTVLFCDIRDFSRITERLGSAETVRWVRDIMDMLSQCVLDANGVLVDYVGDELVAMWGAPTDQPDHAELACQSALSMLAQLPELDRRWEPLIGEATRVGVGINSGLTHVGNTGTARKIKYGPLGNTVNVASRVQGATKYLRTNFLATRDTLKYLQDPWARRISSVRVCNIGTPVDLYEITSCELAPPSWQELATHYDSALLAFENRHFRLAASLLGDLLMNYPQDGPSLLLMSRVVKALTETEPGSFDPVWELPGK